MLKTQAAQTRLINNSTEPAETPPTRSSQVRLVTDVKIQTEETPINPRTSFSAYPSFVRLREG
jgi:hypothetical protein